MWVSNVGCTTQLISAVYLHHQRDLQLNSYCGLLSNANHRYHFQRSLSGSRIIVVHREEMSEFHKEEEVGGKRV